MKTHPLQITMTVIKKTLPAELVNSSYQSNAEMNNKGSLMTWLCSFTSFWPWPWQRWLQESRKEMERRKKGRVGTTGRGERREGKRGEREKEGKRNRIKKEGKRGRGEREGEEQEGRGWGKSRTDGEQAWQLKQMGSDRLPHPVPWVVSGNSPASNKHL